MFLTSKLLDRVDQARQEYETQVQKGFSLLT